jgi:hypothetical protein
MKKLFTLFTMLAMINIGYSTTLTGTLNIPGNYANLAAAIADLNAQGVGAGGVVLNPLTGNPQTAPSGGYIIGGAGSQLLSTANAANTVVIQGNGNTITAYSPQVSGSLNDGIFKIIGGDYITIQGFTLQENSANTFTSAGDNKMTEFGVALFYVTQTDGSKNITIQNNTISLNRLYQNSFGIYSNVRHNSTSLTTAADITSPLGANDYTHIYSNTISNVNEGIVIVGSTANANMNIGTDIGGSTSGTGNTISNYGSTGSISSYTSVSGSVMGIYLNNNLNANISYNSITCPGLNTAGTVYGIFWQGTGAAPTTGNPVNNSIAHNTLSIKSGLAAGTIYGLRYDPGSVLFSYDISYNDFNNFGHTVSGTGSIFCLYTGATGISQNIAHNTFTNLNVNTTGNFRFIYANGLISGATGTQTVTNNSIITGFTKTGSGGTVTCIYNGGVGTVGITNWANNNFSNITLTGTTAFEGITQFDAVSTKTLHDNTLSAITGGTGAITCITTNANADIYNNNFTGISSGGTITVMKCGGTTTILQNVYSNTISGITSSGASAVYGLQSLATGTNSVSNLYKNNIYDIAGSNAGSTVYGIYVSAGTTINTYNNFINDLRSPAANAAIPLSGIYLGGGTTNNVFYNSVYLAGSSSGALFGSAALYASTTPTLDMRNNILVNTCTPTGAGVTAAYRRSTTSLATYSSTSNANDFYAGASEDATHAVYFDGTTPYTLAAYKTLVAPSDAISFRELPLFTNVTSTPYDLHIPTSTISLCESGGLQVTTPFAITDDFDGNSRNSTPDVGADEFNGIPANPVNPGGFSASSISSQQINLNFNINPSLNNVVIVWNATGTFTSPTGTPPAPGGTMANGTVLFNGTISPFSHTGLTAGTNYYYKAFSYAGGGIYSSGVVANNTPSVAPPTSLTAATQSSNQIDLTYTLNAQSDFVLIATNSSSTFGTPVNGTAYSTGNSLPSGGTVIFVGPLSAFSHTGLTPETGYYYSVWSVDAFNYYSATGITANATTFCSAVTSLPWVDGFESLSTVGSNILPACWSHLNINGSNYSCNLVCNDNTAHAGTKFIGGSWNFDVWNFTPGIQLEAGVSYDFSYWFKCTNSTIGYNVSLSYGLLPSVEAMRDVLNSETGLNNTSWTFRSFSFTPAVSGTFFFGLHDVCPSGTPYGIAFDDFKLEASSPCPGPTSLAVTNVTSNSATLGWTSSASAWEYKIVTTGGTPAAPGTATISNPTLVSGLSPGTSYDLFVRSNCSGTYSTWSGPISFTTLCTAAPTPFAEPFTLPSIPGCWTISGPQDWLFQHSTEIPYYGAYGVVDHSEGGAGNFAWVHGSGTPGLTGITLLSNTIDVSSLTTPRVRFYLFNNNISTNELADEQQLRVDLWDGTTWHNGAFLWAYGQNASGWQEELINLNSYTITGPIQLRFVVDKGIGNAFLDDMLIDDISIEETPVCFAPQSLTVVPGNFFANLGWTETGTATSWDIEWGAAGFTQGTGTVINNVTNPYTLTGLSATAAYAYYVRANCGASQSLWIGPKNFVTLVSCPTPTALTATNVQTDKAVLDWTETGTAARWNLEWGPDGFAQGTGTMVNTITSKPFTLSGLNSGTNYAFYVQSDCGEGSTSAWSSPKTFTTVCQTISTFPWIEGFENLATVGSKILPPCMSYENVVGTAGPTSSNTNTIFYGPHNGTQFIYTQLANTTNIFSPAMTLTSGVSYDFSFWMMNRDLTSPVDFLMDVAYGNTNTSAGMTQVLATGIVCNNSSYLQFKYTFTPSNSGTYYLGVRTTSATNIPSAISFDDFRFEPTPACTLPTALSYANVTSTSATLSWTGATNVQFDHGSIGHVAGTGTLTPTTATNPYILTDMAAATSYDVYIRKDCGAGSYSPWFGPVTFTTQCNAAVSPFSEGFEGASFVPDCWSNIAVTGNNKWVKSTAASGYGAGSSSAQANFFSQSAGKIYELLTMPFDIGSLTNPTLKFDYAHADYNGNVDQMDVYYSTNYGSSYNLLLAMPGGATGVLNTAGTSASVFTPNASQWKTQTLALPAGTNMVKFKAISAGGNNLYIDNVQLFSPLDHDVAAVYIGINDVIGQSANTPTAIVKNEGIHTETFSVNLTTGVYSSNKTVTSLAPGNSTTVTFDSWTPPIGNYTATLTTTLAGDMNAANNTISKPVRVMNLNKQVYAYNIYPNAGSDPVGPTTFNLATPGTLNSIADQSPMTGIAGGTWANGLWYVTTGDFPYTLTTLDPATGARTFVGTMPGIINGLSYNPANNTMYGVAYDMGTSTSALYSINLVNGSATIIGNSGTYVLINLAINNSGQAYSVDIATDVLGSVNLSTGIFTPVGPIGFDANYQQDMEFDRETGELFIAANGNATSWLGLVNKTTGVVLKIGNFEGNAEITGFAIPYTISENKTLTINNLKLQGLYTGALTQMNQAFDGSSPKWGAGIADHITVELHSSVDYSLVAQFNDVPLGTNGTASVSVPGIYNSPYYITIKHRNHIETVSAGTQSFAGNTINQSFANPDDVYGGNLGQMPDYGFAIFGGDVNGDGIVDALDFIHTDNAASQMSVGYLPTDANGDGSVNSTDIGLIDQNASTFVGAVTP